MQSNEDKFMAASFEGIMTIIRDMPRNMDAPTLLDVAFSLPLKRADISRFNAQYDEIERQEKEVPFSARSS